MKEIQITLQNGVEKSYLTDTGELLNKKQNGWDMIGFQEVGKKRNTWIPIGANVIEIRIYHAESGRRIKTIDCIEYNK